MPWTDINRLSSAIGYQQERPDEEGFSGNTGTCENEQGDSKLLIGTGKLDR